MLTLFEDDELSAYKICNLVLKDFLALERLSMVVHRMRIKSASRNNPQFMAALIVEYYWGKYKDHLSRENDPIYQLISQAGKPKGGDRSFARTVVRKSLATSPKGKSFKSGRLSASMSQMRAQRSSHDNIGQSSGGEDSKLVLESVEQLKMVVIEMSERLKAMEEKVRGKGTFTFGGGSGGRSRGGQESNRSNENRKDSPPRA